jgi:hypothetical protein
VELLAEAPGVFGRPAVGSLGGPGLDPAAGREVSVPEAGSGGPLVEDKELLPPVEGGVEPRPPETESGDAVPLDDPAARGSELAPDGELESPEEGDPDKPGMPVGELAPREDVLLAWVPFLWWFGDVAVASKAALTPLFPPATAGPPGDGRVPGVSWLRLEEVRVNEERVEDECVVGAGAI